MRSSTIEVSKDGVLMYVIVGTSKFGTEVIDQADTSSAARYLVAEYRLAFGAGWSISYRRKRKSDDD